MAALKMAALKMTALVFLLLPQATFPFQLLAVARNHAGYIITPDERRITHQTTSTTTRVSSSSSSSSSGSGDGSLFYLPFIPFKERLTKSSSIVLRMSSGDNDDNDANADAIAAIDPNELITANIKVSGDVGGYYRVCVLNEAGKFRRLVGTMSNPDDTNDAEIYVEGKRKMVEGFIRWCKRSNNVGLSQRVKVNEVVIGDEPLGLYDEFYCKTK